MLAFWVGYVKDPYLIYGILSDATVKYTFFRYRDGSIICKTRRNLRTHRNQLLHVMLLAGNVERLRNAGGREQTLERQLYT